MSEKEEIVLEREYTIPLRDVWEAPKKKRAEKAIRIIKNFAKRHMKAEEVKISEKVNELIWSKGIEKPPRRIKVIMKKDKDNIVKVEMIGESKEEKEE
ncbi:MAG: 50S ribosomal protein L31e [Nitrososphaerota archaeon]